MDSYNIVKLAVEAILGKKGSEPAVFEIGPVSGYADYVILATATSRRQAVAIADEVERVLQSEGERILGHEGRQTGDWVLLDFGYIVVHIMQEDARSYYQMDSMWDKYKIDVSAS